MTRQRRLAGFLLLPVSLLLAVIGALSYALLQDIGSASRPAAREAERARQLAEAGIAHATWKLNQLTTCSNYVSLPATSLGSDQYQVTVSPSSGSPVTLTATATLASGLAGSSATLRRQVYKTSGNTLTYTVKTDTAGSDTTLNADDPAKNYGGSVTMGLKQNTEYPLLRFDLSNLPVGSRIVDAKLTLYRVNAGSFSLSLRTVEALRVLEPWVDGTKNGATGADGATWQTSDGTHTWQIAGATVESISALDTAHYHVYLSSNPIEWSITNLVQGWVDGRYPNYGLLLRATNDVSSETFATAEGTNSAQVPKLVIKYIAPCGAINPPSDGISGRIAWWKFDESSGTTASDAVAGHAGSVTNGTWSPAGGVSGGALAFNSAGKVSIPHTADLSQTGDFSLAAWVNMSNQNGKRPVLYKGTNTNEANYAFGARDGNLYFEYFSSASNSWQTFTTSGLNLRPGTYYHFAVTYKASTRTIRFYLDGIQVGSATASFGNTPQANTRNLLIGSTPYNESFLGRIDDVQIIAANLDVAGIATVMGARVNTAAADAQISSELFATGNNYGTTTTLIVQNPADIRSLVRFDLSGIPAGTPVKRAILSFHIESANVVLNLKANAYPLKESWVEGTQNGSASTSGVTWAKRQTSPNLNWTNQGGTYDNVIAGILNLPLLPGTQRYYEMDITPTVQEWVDGVRANQGLLLLMGIGLDSVRIHSRENLRQEPRLLIGTQ